MQSRREEDHDNGTRSSRLRDPRIQMGINPNFWEVVESSPRIRRSFSPPGRVVGGGGERRGGWSFDEEGRDFGWQVGGVNVRAERENFRSQSPSFGRMNERRRNFDEGFPDKDKLRRKYGFCDALDYKDEFGPGLDCSSFRGDVDRDRVLDDAHDQILSGRSRVLERRSMNRGEYRSQAELEYSLSHAEDTLQFSLSSGNVENARFDNESTRYPDPFLHEKLVALETYRKEEEYRTQSREFSYSVGSANLSKDTSQLTKFAGDFSRSSRENMMGSYEDDVSLPKKVHPNSSAQPVEQYSFPEVHQRHNLGTQRSRAGNREQDYLFTSIGFGEKDRYVYPSEELRGRRCYHDNVDYYRRDIISSNVMEPNRQRMIHAGYSQRCLKGSDSWDNPSSQDQLASKYLFSRRSLEAVDEQVRREQVRHSMDPETANVEFDGRVLEEAEVSLLSISPNDVLSRRTTRGSERDAFFVSSTESMWISADNRGQMEIAERDLRMKIIYSDELDTYDPPRRSLKRKYDIDEELSSYRARDTLSGNAYNLNSSKYQYERGDEWNNQDTMDLLPSKNLEYNQNKYRKAEREVNFVEHSGDLTSDDHWSYRDPVDYKQAYSSKPFKHGKRILKGRPRHGLSGSYNSQNFNKRRPLIQNVWLKGKDSKEMDKSANETQESKNWASSFESVPPEESKEFKELVQASFLSFSKMLNESLGTRKRYKEQGRAGSLFCIVCGKRVQDTKGLATHCFMSKKVGLRAQHLGLHKAICVVLGWNVVGTEVITFAPQAISSSEALAQKEDLILWPPAVIIHCISVSASCPGGQNVFTKEVVEDFLRGKGFSIGRIKMCLGMSANNTMIVKFLGTFPGLQDAEKLHKYFLDDRHGRIEFEQMSLIKGKDSNTRKEKLQADKLEEHVLYGYMAIAEDLDKVDFDTKRKCSVRSKKEIEYIADEPLRF